MAKRIDQTAHVEGTGAARIGLRPSAFPSAGWRGHCSPRFPRGVPVGGWPEITKGDLAEESEKARSLNQSRLDRGEIACAGE